jgi:3-methyl-2-oxobutanoate hydroxymethyltransferase
MAQDTGKSAPAAEKKREKRTITEIRDSKKSGEKMVYMSVPDYTSAKWAEMAGVDVAVVGDSLAMIAHGHLHHPRYHGHDGDARPGDLQAPAPSCSAACPIRATTRWSALTNATRFMRRAAMPSNQQGGKSQAHISRPWSTPHPDYLHIGLTRTPCHVRRLQDPGRTADAAMKILRTRSPSRTPAAHAGVRGGAGEDRQADLEQLTIPTIGIGAGVGNDGRSCSATTCSASHRLPPKFPAPRR